MDIEDQKDMTKNLTLDCIDMIEEETLDIESEINRFLVLASIGANVMESGLYMMWTHLDVTEKQKDEIIEDLTDKLMLAIRETLKSNIMEYKNQSRH